MVLRRLWFQIFLVNVVLGIHKQHYSRDPEVSYNFVVLTVLSFRRETEKETQAGRRIRNSSSLVLITPEFDQRGKVLNEQTLFAIYHPGLSCNPPGRVGSDIGKTYKLLKVDSESHQVQFYFKCRQFKVR